MRSTIRLGVFLVLLIFAAEILLRLIGRPMFHQFYLGDMFGPWLPTFGLFGANFLGPLPIPPLDLPFCFRHNCFY